MLLKNSAVLFRIHCSWTEHQRTELISDKASPHHHRSPPTFKCGLNTGRQVTLFRSPPNPLASRTSHFYSAFITPNDVFPVPYTPIFPLQAPLKPFPSVNFTDKWF